jgi:AcrR family transcriptional regulator
MIRLDADIGRQQNNRTETLHARVKRRKADKQGSYHHGDLRRALLDAALSLVEREGATGVSLRAVARKAGVSPAAPYRHFSGKEGLLAAVSEEGFRAMADSMMDARAQHRDIPLAGFRAVGLAYVRFAASHPSHFRVMFGPDVSDKSAHPDLRDASERAFGVLATAILDCQRPGLVDGVEPRQLAIAAWATFHGLATLLVDGQLKTEAATDAHLVEATNRVTDVIYRGLSYSGL